MPLSSVFRPALLLVAVALLVSGDMLNSSYAFAEEGTKSTSANVLPSPASKEAIPILEKLIGKKVLLVLSKGQRWPRTEFLGFSKRRSTGEPSQFRIRKEDSKPSRVSAKSVASILYLDEVVLEKPIEKTSSAKSSKRRKSSLAQRKAAKKLEEDARWTAKAKANGVTLWPKGTKKEHKAAIADYRAMIEKAKSRYSNMAVYETERFIFCTNIPKAQAAPYIRSLDKMHDMMCKMYGLPVGERVWLGKCPVFAFISEREFLDFEGRFFGVQAGGAYGICHSSSNGQVTIACYRGDNPNDFGQMLVHETSHGFIHRYKTAARLPSWVNEGMAEYIGEKMVPGSKQVKLKELSALMQMKQRRNLGGNYFDLEKNIDAWQYGVASSMTKFLVNSNPKAYVKFIDSMKAGTKWDQALLEAYKAKPEQLLQHYGRTVGVPNLMP